MGDIDWSRVTAADLPGEMRDLAEEAGLEVVRHLVETYAGCMIYVPTLRDLKRRQLAERAARLFDGTNAVAVCRKLRVSRRTLNDLLKEATDGAA